MDYRFKLILNLVKDFQIAFRQDVAKEQTLVSQEVGKLRYKLMKEENEEYRQAVENDDFTEIADALGDQLYVLCGTILSHGLQDSIQDVFTEIHRSNMSKLDDNGEPIINGEGDFHDETRPEGKVLKSKNYFKPNIAGVLKRNAICVETKKLQDLYTSKSSAEFMLATSEDWNKELYEDMLVEINRNINIILFKRENSFKMVQNSKK